MAQVKQSKKDQIREAAENDLEVFIHLIHPDRVLGRIHKRLIRWWTKDGASSHQLVLLPRDHQKSAMIAYRVVWELTKNPSLRILYISSTSKLATKQLKFIKDIFTSDRYRFYWPDMVLADESKREKWTEGEIALDHPKRKAEFIRDPSIFTAGLTTNITGLHCDIAVLDDVVVDDNAYTDEGRDKVRAQASYLASIAGVEAKVWAVGTRYHPKDLYNDMKEQIVRLYDEEGTETSYLLWEVFEEQVEDRGDGFGEFLWPRQQNSKGQWFGFDSSILAKKKAQYYDPVRFYSQYYNNPNEGGDSPISEDMIQFYNRKLLHRDQYGVWYYQNSKLNVFAAIDFAYSLARKADYTAIVVVGMDSRNNYYVLDIDRFKTQKISEYFDRILRLHNRWGFRKIRAEVSVAQEVIVKDLKENYIKVHGVSLSVDEHRPTVKEGSKEERMLATLQPKYSNGQVWHYDGGNCEILEEELTLSKPPHDDIKDCLASCLEICVAPTQRARIALNDTQLGFHPRFGGTV